MYNIKKGLKLLRLLIWNWVGLEFDQQTSFIHRSKQPFNINQIITQLSYKPVMSFQNTIGQDGSININVIPSFGRIVNVLDQQKDVRLRQVEAARARFGALKSKPADFDPTRYVSFSTREVVEEPVEQQHIHEYVERSRLSRRLGF